MTTPKQDTGTFIPRVTFRDAQDAWSCYVALANATAQIQLVGAGPAARGLHQRLSDLTADVFAEYRRLIGCCEVCGLSNSAHYKECSR